MSDVTILLTIPPLNSVKEEAVEVPDDCRIDALCLELGKEFSIPAKDQNGNPIKYQLENTTQKLLYQDSDTLASKGIHANDKCALTYTYVAGRLD